MRKSKIKEPSTQKGSQTRISSVTLPHGSTVNGSSADDRHPLPTRNVVVKDPTNLSGAAAAEGPEPTLNESAQLQQQSSQHLPPVDERYKNIVMQPYDTDALMAALHVSDDILAINLVAKHFKLSISPQVAPANTELLAYAQAIQMQPLGMASSSAPSTPSHGKSQQHLHIPHVNQRRQSQSMSASHHHQQQQQKQQQQQQGQQQIQPAISARQSTQQQINMMMQAAPKYDRHAEDTWMRNQILARYILDAARIAYMTGMSSVQCAIWLTVFTKAHDQYIEHARQSGKNGPELCLPIFKKLLIESCHIFGKQQPEFTMSEFRWLTDYVIESYGQHARLIAQVFTTPQGLQVDRLHRSVGVYAPRPSSHTFLPLVQGIPAERWEEHCRQEEERLRLEKQAEDAMRDAARLQAIADAKAKMEAKRASELLHIQHEAERGLVAPFMGVSNVAVPRPSLETVFRRPDPTIFRRLLQEQKDHAQAQQQGQAQPGHPGQAQAILLDGSIGADVSGGGGVSGQTSATASHGHARASNVQGVGRVSGTSGAPARGHGVSAQSGSSAIATGTIGGGGGSGGGPEVRSNDTKGQGPSGLRRPSGLTHLQETAPPVAAEIASGSTAVSGTDANAMNAEASAAMEAAVSELSGDGGSDTPGVIAPDKRLSRVELSAVLMSNISEIMGGLVQGLATRMDSQAVELQSRVERVQAAMRAREEERLAREREAAEAAAAAAAAASGVSAMDMMAQREKPAGKAGASGAAAGGARKAGAGNRAASGRRL